MLDITLRVTQYPLTSFNRPWSTVYQWANEIIGRAFAGDRVQTIAYHPEIDGRIEHMHATLESMLAKCRKRGIDWVEQ